MAKKEIQYNSDGKEICGAKRKNGKGACGSTILIGKTGRCAMHGGLTPSGLASPNLRTGRHSKYLPVGLYEKFAEAHADPLLFELRSEVALVDARIGELLTRIGKNDSTELWKRLEDGFDTLNKTIMSGDKTIMSGDSDAQAVVNALRALGKIINDGIGDWAAWKEITVQIEQRRRLVESERLHQKQMQQLVSVDQMMLLAGALLASVKTHVTDRKALSAISKDFDRHMNIS